MFFSGFTLLDDLFSLPEAVLLEPLPAQRFGHHPLSTPLSIESLDIDHSLSLQHRNIESSVIYGSDRLTKLPFTLFMVRVANTPARTLQKQSENCHSATQQENCHSCWIVLFLGYQMSGPLQWCTSQLSVQL